MKIWRNSHRGSWHLYGHSHGGLHESPNSLSFDVGVDARDYRPISFDEVSKLMAKKTFKPIDHHGAKTVNS
jgi:calcineurin-like phosphoesterase family protein